MRIGSNAELQIDHGWSAVRCVFRTVFSPTAYEERITLWHTSDLTLAIQRAEQEAEEYAGNPRSSRDEKVDFTDRSH